MVHFLNLIRWKNLLIIVLTQLFAYVFLDQEQCMQLQIETQFILICLSTVLLAAGGYIINDYSDVRIDVINKPDNLIVSRYISKRVAFALHLVINFAGVFIAFFVNYKFGILSFFIAFLLWQYSVRFKYIFFFGNVLVSALMALSIMVLGFASNSILVLWLIYYTVFAFLTGLIREIIKDIEDMEGDAVFNAKTLPNTLGIPRTKIVIYYLMILTLCILVLSCAFLFMKGYIILPVYLLLATALPLAIFFQKTISADSKKDFSFLSRMIKLIMLAGVVSMGLRCI